MKKNSVSLANVKSIAFVMSPRLGDCLISMVVTHNLRRHGFKVTTFNNYLAALRSYFPQEDIQPYPDQSVGREILSQYDLLIYMADYNVAFESDQWHPNIVILDDYALYHRAMPMVDIQLAVCREIFGLTDLVKINGVAAPPTLKFRANLNRVIIHPSASHLTKQWLPARFISLAQRLKEQGYEPVFVLAPAEKDEFSWIPEHGFTYVADQAMEFLPKFLYESGWFIGNDSGVGHLASNLGIPTITLLSRKSVKCRWRPGWAPGEALLPWMPLLLRPWKKNYWKYFISVDRVMHTFIKMTAQYSPRVFSKPGELLSSRNTYSTG